MGRIYSLTEAVAERRWLRAARQPLVFTNGLFDLLHAGHVDYLERARGLGAALFVGLNSDASARRLKGERRPIVPLADRARLLAALACVDGVIPFEEDTAEDLVRALEPDVYVKGGDYRAKALPEALIVEGYGGRVELVELLPERSTTALIERIVQRFCPPLENPDAG